MGLHHLLAPTGLFILLSPMIITVLPSEGDNMWMSGKTNWISVIVQAIIFMILLWLIHIMTME